VGRLRLLQERSQGLALSVCLARLAPVSSGELSAYLLAYVSSIARGQWVGSRERSKYWWSRKMARHE
jgi:hypothetical protein